MFVALVIQHAMRMRHIVICGLSGSTIFIHIIKTAWLSTHKKIIQHKMCFDFLYSFPRRHFLTSRTIQRDIIINI